MIKPVDPSSLSPQTARAIEQLKRHAQYEIDAQIGAQVEALRSALPAGVILMFGNTTAPDGWLECNGASLLRADYPDLFAAIGTTFGAADGTHFSLPQLQGEFVRGWDNGRGVDAARVFGSAQVEMIGPHTHTETRRTGTVSTGVGGSSGTGTGLQTVNTGENTGTENRPRNVALMYCIKC